MARITTKRGRISLAGLVANLLITVASVTIVSTVAADVMCLSPSGGITIRPEDVCRSNEIKVDPASVSATVAHEMEQIAALQAQTAALERLTDVLQEHSSAQAGLIEVLQSEKADLQAQVTALQTDTEEQAAALAGVQDKLVKTTPVGTILDFGGTTAPEGYLLCNGEAVSRTEYADLFAAIGTNFGEGDGTTTFNLPDLRGRFTRGWDMGSGNDPDSGFRFPIRPGGAAGDNVGSYQQDAVAVHNHQQMICQGPGLTGFGIGGIPCDGSQGSRLFTGPNGGRPETRPRNVAVNKIIKH